MTSLETLTTPNSQKTFYALKPLTIQQSKLVVDFAVMYLTHLLLKVTSSSVNITNITSPDIVMQILLTGLRTLTTNWGRQFISGDHFLNSHDRLCYSARYDEKIDADHYWGWKGQDKHCSLNAVSDKEWSNFNSHRSLNSWHKTSTITQTWKISLGAIPC